MLLPPNRAAEFRQAFEQKRWITDGAMATMLYAKGASRHKPVEEHNLSLPALVRDVHREYLAAGAEILSANTFSANRIRLANWDLESKLAPINRAAVRIARETAKDQAYVAGVIGPTGLTLAPLGQLSEEQARAAFAQQASALYHREDDAAYGVDLFVLQTFSSVTELRAAIEGVRDTVGKEPVIIAQLTVDQLGRLADGTLIDSVAQEVTLLPADAVGVNCSAGPYAVRQAIRALQVFALHSSLPAGRKLSASPSAGVWSTASPEYFVRQMPRVHVVGGCCGTTPDHIRALRTAVDNWPAEEMEPAQPLGMPLLRSAELAMDVSRFRRKLAAGEFVILGEAARDGNWRPIQQRLVQLGLGQPDAVGIPAPTEPQALAAARTIQSEQAIETILYLTARGRSARHLQGELFATNMLHLQNILCLTGDGPTDADIDSIGLVRIAASLNGPVKPEAELHPGATNFTIGVALNPYAADLNREVARFQAKVEAGAHFAITQPIFDVTVFEDLLQRIAAGGSAAKIPIIAGLRQIGGASEESPSDAARMADYIVNEQNITIPPAVLDRIAAGQGEAVARELADSLRPLAQGLHMTFC